jgi:hypothetical protein
VATALETAVGKLVFQQGQLNRIVNFDETDKSIVDTTGRKIG